MNKLFRKISNYALKPRSFDFRKTPTLHRPLFSTAKIDTSKFLKNALKFSASAFLFSFLFRQYQTQCESVLTEAQQANAENTEAHAEKTEPVVEKTEAGVENTETDVHTKILPVEIANMTFAPNVPPPITRKHHALVRADFEFSTVRGNVTRGTKYDFWAINGSVPGPFIRCRVGDTLEVNVINHDESGMPHNLDLHCVMGPGGGSALTTVQHTQQKSARFKLKHPGIFIYHCATAPIPLHIANGMYGLILVEPAGGLPWVNREYYVMQSEFYFDRPVAGEVVATMAYDKGLLEQPDAVVFNGREGSLTDKNPLKAKAGETVRIFFGNAGPNLVSSFHIIGAPLDRVYRDGDLLSPPARSIQTVLVPPGGATVVEFKPLVQGNYALTDHAIFRLDKGAVGFLNVSGPKRPDIYGSGEEPYVCPDCKVHP